jgi:uncharacterized protein with HEPN domain
MQRDDDVYLGHMLDLSRKVALKITGVRREEFDEDENLRLALAHLLQTIGEAARRVSREFQITHPEIPWAGIVGMRHKVVHDYMDVDEDVVWTTSVDEIPQLITALEPAHPELTSRTTKPLRRHHHLLQSEAASTGICPVTSTLRYAHHQ